METYDVAVVGGGSAGVALLRGAIAYVAFPLLLLAIWQGLAMSGLYRRQVLPAPTDVILVWADLVVGNLDQAGRYAGTWFDHARSSTVRSQAGANCVRYGAHQECSMIPTP